MHIIIIVVTVHRVWPKNDVESKDTGISIQILSFAYLHHLLLFPEQKKNMEKMELIKCIYFGIFSSASSVPSRISVTYYHNAIYAYVGVGSCLHLFILLALTRAPIHASTSYNDCLSMNMHSVCAGIYY